VSAVLLPPPLAEDRGVGSPLHAEEPNTKDLAKPEPPIAPNLDLLAMSSEGVAKLRELILTLAVQGKLVPQDSRDEPASVLLQKIGLEKDRLIAEGKIRRDKPLLKIAEEEKPFELPQMWEWVRLGATMEMINGKPFKPSDWLETGLPIVRIQNLNRLDAPFNYCDPQAISEKNKIYDGSFLISWSGTPGTSFGAFIWRRGLAALNQHIFKCELIGNAFAPDFLRLSINSQLSVLISKAQGGVGLQHVTKSTLENLVLVLPPIAEQLRIVARVEELMRLCDALEAKGKLEAAQHAQLLNTLLGTLTDSETPEALAENWQRVAAHFDLLLDRPEAVDALEQTILQLAVRGLLVPQDPSNEPASVLLQKIRAEKDCLIAEGKLKPDKPPLPLAKDERPFSLPRGWEWGRLDDISVVIVDCPHSTPKFASSGLLCLDTNSFKNGELLPHKLRYVDQTTFTERTVRLQPQPGDLVFAREGSVGESVIIPGGTIACLGQRVMLFRFSKQMSNEFVRLAITSRWFLNKVLALHKGIGAKHVNVGDMRAAVIPLPPMAEQSRIVARVESLRRLCAELRERLSASQATRAHLAESLVASATA
jgi:type I restriction enzyme, S subunit